MPSKEEAEQAPQLYLLTLTTVVGMARIDRVEDEDDTAEAELLSKTQTLIVEKVAQLPPDVSPLQMLDRGLMLKFWLTKRLPETIHSYSFGKPAVVVLHSIEPYEARKRGRSV